MSTLTLRALLVVGGIGLGWNVSIVEAHQCVQVAILQSPQQVHAGSQASMVAGVINCGGCPTPVQLDAWLFDPGNNVRVHLGDEFLRLPMNDVRRVKLLLDIPNNVAPGHYQLVLSGETSGGYMDIAYSADELGIREAIPTGGDITGEIVDKDKKEKEIRVKNAVGREQTVKVTTNTVIEDLDGNPLTFDDIREGDRVEVDYNGRNEATKIVKLN